MIKKAYSPVILVLLLLIAACGNNGGAAKNEENQAQPAAAKPVTIRVGLVCGGLNQIPVLVGLDQGIFEQAGLNVERNCFDSGTDSVQALVGGSLDVNFGSYEHVLRQRNNHLDVKAYGNFNNTMGYYLMVKNDSKMKTVTDLKGAAIGVTKTGTLSDTGLRLILKQENIDPNRDVQIVNAGTGSTMLAALESGKVQAGMVGEPNASQMIASGNYRILYNPEFPYVGLVAMAKTAWVDQNPEAFDKFLAALKQIRQQIEDNPQATAQEVISNYENVGEDVLEQAIERWLTGFPADMIITKEGTDAVVASQEDLGTISAAVPFEEAVDLSHLPK